MKKQIVIVVFVLFSNLVVAATPFPSLKQSAFNSIHAAGCMKLIIKPSSRSGVSFVEKHDLTSVNAKVSHHVLYLSSSKSNLVTHHPPTVIVRLYRLDALNLEGRVSVLARKVISDHLNLDFNTVGSVRIGGHLVVKHIYNRCPALVKLTGIQGVKLLVDSLAGRIILSGRVNRLRARLCSRAIMDARALKAKSILIQTKDFATGSVLPLKDLHAFASDFSKIYYYKCPKVLSLYTRYSGAVLPLKSRSTHFS